MYCRLQRMRRNNYCSEEVDRTALSGIALLDDDNGYSRRGNFGCSLVRSMVLTYSPDGTNVYSSRGGSLRE